jgi:hypothetical protein
MSSCLSAAKNDIYALRRSLTKAKREFMKTLSDFGVARAYDIRIAAKAIAYADAVGRYRKAMFAEGLLAIETPRRPASCRSVIPRAPERPQPLGRTA